MSGLYILYSQFEVCNKPALILSKLLLLLFYSFLHPFQDYFSSYEMGQPVGGRKWENTEKNQLAHPQAELGLSHMWQVRGSNPHRTQRWDEQEIKKQRSYQN